MGVHVMLDEKTRPVRDDAVQGCQARGDVIGRIQPLAHIMKQSGQHELLIIWPLRARQLRSASLRQRNAPAVSKRASAERDPVGLGPELVDARAAVDEEQRRRGAAR